MRAIIVDDEAPSRELVREYLGTHADVQVVAECGDGFEAVKAATELSPDLLFLDIQMPKLDGFEVLQLIGRKIAVVFITAYDEHAVRAFEVHAVDYLLKPFTPERLAEAMDRARRRLDSGDEIPVAALAAAARPQGFWSDRILVRDGPRVSVIPVGKIDFVEAQDDYVSIRAEGRSHLKQQTLAELETTLDPSRFVRIHRSYILNIERLAKIELYAKDSRIAILTEGSKLPVSRAGYAKLKLLL
ncbi:MAG: response regulator [Acidobacteria bacterium]|nr:response regulator [Acidobacteriota bacterium]